MKRLFLASSIETTGPAVIKEITNDPKKLKLVFINTAGEVDKGNKSWVDDDRKGLEKTGVQITNYTLTEKTYSDLEKDLSDFDIIHVNGGNTFYLLQQARKCGFDKWMKRALEKGKIYTSSSAGTDVSGNNIEHVKFADDPGDAPDLKDYTGFKLIDRNIIVHWGSDNGENKRKQFEFLGDNPPVVLSDWEYLKVEGEMYKIVDIRGE
jgi:dipeptidase E